MSLSKQATEYWAWYEDQLKEKPILTKVRPWFSMRSTTYSGLSGTLPAARAGRHLGRPERCQRRYRSEAVRQGAPVVFNCAALCCADDSPLAQGSLDVSSIRNQFLIGITMRGPLVHYWFKLMNHIFDQLVRQCTCPRRVHCSLARCFAHMQGLGTKEAQGKMSTAVVRCLSPPRPPLHSRIDSILTLDCAMSQAKVVLDQTTFGPFFNYLYFWAIGLLEGRSGCASLCARLLLLLWCFCCGAPLAAFAYLR